MCLLSWNLGVSDSWNPQGLSMPVMGLLYLRLYAPFFSTIHATRPAYPILLNLITRTTLGVEYRQLSSSWCSVLRSLVTFSRLCPTLPQHPILEHPPPIFPCWRPTNSLSGASVQYFVVQNVWRSVFVHPCSRLWKYFKLTICHKLLNVKPPSTTVSVAFVTDI